MSVAIVTGASGLVGAEASRHFARLGMDILGIDNDMRAYFFGPEASTLDMRRRVEDDLGDAYRHIDADIRDAEAIDHIFKGVAGGISLVIHAAAQPSHDWAAQEPRVDFGVNAVGTLNLLEATRKFSPAAPFIFTSTNKVYGDAPNRLPLKELATRWELPDDHELHGGVHENFPVDQSLHSLFGASKLAADVLVQEYGRYFGMNTACFRGGCLTGSGHAGTELHGFLAYLMKCTAVGRPYRVLGYKGKQVRDNIHASDLVAAFEAFFREPRQGQVYNVGGGRESNCSMLEAITACEEITGRGLTWSYEEENRVGDHMWWISDLSRFKSHYPKWELEYGIGEILHEIYEGNRQEWLASTS
jgi:CDP-paratose 2-epimerase